MKPAFVLIDFETSENGKGSTEFYRKNFRVDSMAASWFAEDGSIKSKYLEGEDAITAFLARLVREEIPYVAHNVQFELGVLKCRFPTVADKLSFHADTMRLAQIFDNGGDKFAVAAPLTYDEELGAFLDKEGDEDEEGEKPKKKKKAKGTAGLGLVKCALRILKLPDHKSEAHAWIRANVPECKEGKEGKFLNLLPRDIAERYNVADTEVALKLYKHCVDYFKEIGYDWTKDHRFYFNSVKLLVGAKIRGVAVQRTQLSGYRESVAAEIAQMGADFRATFEKQILAVERERLAKYVGGCKTLRGKKRRVQRYKRGDPKAVVEVRFNVGSNHQLESLFIVQLGHEPRFKTPKGKPAFRSSVLHVYGEGGNMLAKRRKRLLVLKQSEALLELSEYDSRIHFDLKACGTATSRYSGGQHA